MISNYDDYNDENNQNQDITQQSNFETEDELSLMIINNKNELQLSNMPAGEFA